MGWGGVGDLVTLHKSRVRLKEVGGVVLCTVERV